jgi:hypothetical protein
MHRFLSNSRFNILSLLFISFFHITRGFKFLNNLQVEVVTIFFLLFIFINSNFSKISNFKFDKALIFYLISICSITLALLFFWISEEDTHCLKVAYFYTLPIFYIYLLLANSGHGNNPDKILKYYSIFTFLLSFLNILMFIEVSFLRWHPFFTIELGTIQPRVYAHYLTGVLGEASRYISYFGEPSDFVWIIASGFFILLKYEFYLMAFISLFSIVLSGSGAVPVFLLIFIFLTIFQKKLNFFIVLSILVMTLIAAYLTSDGTLARIFFRWFDPDSHQLSVNRINFLLSGHISDTNSLSLPLYQTYPTKIDGPELLNYTNNFFYTIARLGIFSIPIILSSSFLMLKSFKTIMLRKEYELATSLLCFILLLFTRESFNFILVFWFLYIFIQKKTEKSI